jgi:cytochrome P450
MEKTIHEQPASDATLKLMGTSISRALTTSARGSPTWTLFVLLVTYFAGRCIYNLYFHPLHKIPGPRIAAMTSFYDFWYDVVRGGTYLWEIGKMHEVYGPIVRINPNEVHINDPEYYNNIYAGGSRRVNKDPSTLAGFSVPTSVAATEEHDLHRQRRSYMSPYFARRSIVSMEPLIHERITAMLKRLDQARESDTLISLDKAFSAMTADIIASHFFGYHYNYLNIPDLRDPIREGFKGISEMFHLTRFAPWMTLAFKALPVSLVRRLQPAVGDLLDLRDSFERNITRISRAKDDANGDELASLSKSVIIEALGDERIPPEERTMDRLVDEGQVILFAGTENSARTLAIGMFHMLNNRELLAKARQDLAPIANVPDEELTMAMIEGLPYLTGMVKESIRLTYGPVTRLPRVATEETLHYKEYAIPPGTPVSQIHYFVHTNEAIFPEPLRFNPDRWVQAAEQGFPLNNYLVSFSKGSRQCLGMSLAYAEIYLTFVRIIRNFEMELANTTIDDVTIHRAHIVGQPKIVRGKGEGQGEVKVYVTAKL